MPTIERVTTILLTLASMTIAGVLVKREFSGAAGATAAQPVKQLAPATYAALRASSRPLGDTSGILTVVEFMDLECPYCRELWRSMDSLSTDERRRVAVRVAHFPLPIHTQARTLALAAECARERGLFAAFLDDAYRPSSSSSVRSVWSIAESAGVSDSVDFLRCVESERHGPVVDSGVAMGQRMGIPGTPTVIVDGWVLPRPPTSRELRAMLVAASYSADSLVRYFRRELP